MNFVTVKESHYQGDLVVLKSRLESEGIKCRLKNELTTQVLNHIPSFVIELQVPDDKVDQARKIMIETGEVETPAALVKCPKCDSQDVGLQMDFGTRMKLFFKSIGGALTLKTPDVESILQSGKYKCKNCGEEFK